MSMFGDDVLNGLIKYGQEYLYIMVDPVAGLVFVNGTKLGKQFLLVDRPDIVDSFSKLCLKKGQTEKPGIIPVHLYANSKSTDDEPDHNFQSKDTTDVTPILIKPEPVSEDEEEKEKTSPESADSTDKETKKAPDISKDATIPTPTDHMNQEDNSAMFTQIHPQEDDEDDNTVDNNEDVEEPSETPSRGQKRKNPYASEDSAVENTTHCDPSDVAVKVEVKDTGGKNDQPRRSLRTPKKKAYFNEDETVWEEVTYPSADGKTVVDVKPKITPAAQESEDMHGIDESKPIEMLTKSSSLSVEWDSSEDIPVSGSEKKHCQTLNHADLDQNATSKNKEKGRSVHTKRAVTLFKKWLSERHLDEHFERLSQQELDKYLRCFFAEIRNPEGNSYSGSAFAVIRCRPNQYPSNLPHDRNRSLCNDNDIKKSDLVLTSIGKQVKDEVLPKSLALISKQDLEKLRNYFSTKENPRKLLQKVWFDIQSNFPRRVCANLTALTVKSFLFKTDKLNREYAELDSSEKTTQRIQTGQTRGRMYSTNYPDCPVGALKFYISKTNTMCEKLFQRPVSGECFDRWAVWYQNKPLGKLKMQSMMKEISEDAHLSQIYTTNP